MELKEYFKIIKNNQRLFFGVVILTLFSVGIYFYLQPIYYNASLTLNITRVGTQKTADYRFDNFYRLQADEKICETIVQWLKSPSIVYEIYSQSGNDISDLNLKKISKIISVEKRSSQVVAVNYVSPNKEMAQKIAENIIGTISKNIEKLNEEQKEDNWFRIIGEKPLIVRNSLSYLFIFLASLLFGIFLAFWIVMIKHYLK